MGLTNSQEKHVESLPKISEYMTSDVITVSSTVDIYYIAGMFLANKFRRLPVVEGGKIVGAITRYDLLRIIRTLSN